jgi:hypothetical protein
MTPSARLVDVTYRLDDGDSTSETSVNFYETTRRNIPEYSKFYLTSDSSSMNCFYLCSSEQIYVFRYLIVLPQCYLNIINISE